MTDTFGPELSKMLDVRCIKPLDKYIALKANSQIRCLALQLAVVSSSQNQICSSACQFGAQGFRDSRCRSDDDNVLRHCGHSHNAKPAGLRRVEKTFRIDGSLDGAKFRQAWIH